jgi:hypothetical protein
MKNHSLGAELFHANGHTDSHGQTDRQMNRHDEANSRFTQFCEKRLKTRGYLDRHEPNYVFFSALLTDPNNQITHNPFRFKSIQR